MAQDGFEGGRPAAVPPMRGLALRGAAVLGGAQVVKTAAQFGSVIILSRLLEPADFGIAAATAPIVAFMTIFQDLGFQQGLIQKAALDSGDLTRVFWLTLALASGLVLAMAAGSPVAAWFFHDPRLQLVTAVAGLPLLGYALAVVPSALLSRNTRFGSIAVVEGVTACIGLATAILGALAGLHYWALVLSTLASSAAGAAMMGLAAGWWPSRPVLAWPEPGLVHFGKNLTGFSVANYFGQNSDNLLIGHAWGGLELGYYDRAFKLLLLPVQSLGGPTYRIMIPLMSRIQLDQVRLRQVYLRAASLFLLAVMPGMAALVATAPDVIDLAFGPRWSAVKPIFFWLGLVGLSSPLGVTTGWLFISQAQTQAMFRSGVIQSSSKVLSFAAGLHWGPVGVAMAFAITEYGFRLPFSYWWVSRIGPATKADLLSLQAPLFASAGLTWVISHQMLAHLAGLPLIGLTTLVSYGTALAAMTALSAGRNALREAYGLVIGAAFGTVSRLAWKRP